MMADFKPRFTIPEKGNKYYNRKPEGYGTSIQGYPLQAGLTCLSNCVGFVAARFNEIGNYGLWKYWNYPPNAEEFWNRAESEGLKKGSEPKLGAILVFEGIGSAAGHVAVVEQVNADRSIITSESGYGAAKPFWTQSRFPSNKYGESDKYRFLGFIYQPEEKPTKVDRVLKEGCEGSDVELMQARLHVLGYMRANEVDGDFGKITKGAVLCFQLEHELEVDGICGPATRKELGI